MPGLSEQQKKFVSLRDLTIHHGTIHELQLVQLAYWFMAIVPGLKTPPEFNYDADQKQLIVAYPANADMGKDFDKGINMLRPSVQWLLGDAVNVNISYMKPDVVPCKTKSKRNPKKFRKVKRGN